MKKKMREEPTKGHKVPLLRSSQTTQGIIILSQYLNVHINAFFFFNFLFTKNLWENPFPISYDLDLWVFFVSFLSLIYILKEDLIVHHSFNLFDSLNVPLKQM